VIAPYAAQISAVQQILHDEKKFEHLAGLLGRGREQSPMAVEISTVDGFEGREKKIIVFSTTRSNPRHAIGFMDDWRRLNVALTRAQRVSGCRILPSRRALMGFCMCEGFDHGRELSDPRQRTRLPRKPYPGPAVLDGFDEISQKEGSGQAVQQETFGSPPFKRTLANDPIL
jgi:hypothetical protein